MAERFFTRILGVIVRCTAKEKGEFNGKGKNYNRSGTAVSGI